MKSHSETVTIVELLEGLLEFFSRNPTEHEYLLDTVVGCALMRRVEDVINNPLYPEWHMVMYNPRIDIITTISSTSECYERLKHEYIPIGML